MPHEGGKEAGGEEEEPDTSAEWEVAGGRRTRCHAECPGENYLEGVGMNQGRGKDAGDTGQGPG